MMDREKKMFKKGSRCLFGAVFIAMMILLSANAFAKTAAAKPALSSKKMFFFVGGKAAISLNNAGKKKVTWSSSDKSVATVSKKGKITAKSIGKCYVSASCNKKTYKCRIIVLSDEDFLKSYCKDAAAQIKKAYTSPYDRVILAAMHVSGSFTYGFSNDAFDALRKKQGTCVSGNQLLVEILKKMGFQAELRFAGNDDMSRYPSNVIFYENHHNVKVKIKGKTYYVDGTPGGICVYLSSQKKPLFCATGVFGGWQVILDKLHKKK